MERQREPVRDESATEIETASSPVVRDSRMARRRFLKRTGQITGGLLGYSLLVEPSIPFVTCVEIPISNLPPAFDGFRIAVLSDLHLHPLFPAWRLTPAFSAVMQEKPDLITLLGDYTNYGLPDSQHYVAECAAAASVLSAAAGVYAIFGNHDYLEPPHTPSPAAWRAANITSLQDQSAEIWHKQERLFLVGLASALMRPTSPFQCLHLTPKDATRIILWHEPDRAAESAHSGASLQLSGHTHGGQVRLPLVGPLYLPTMGKKYASGLYQVNQMPLYVTRGVGVLPPFVRFCCPPEVTLITLRYPHAS